MLTDPLTAAIAEAEKIVATAPHIRTEADLTEGYGYLAGGIAACVHATWAYSSTHPVFVTGTGPYAKMGLDNPDTLYWGAVVRDNAEYVVTGRRGTTCDLSFQVLAGNYTDAAVPGNVTAFDDRALRIEDDGSFEVRFGPGPRDPDRNYFTLAPGSSQLVVREVYSDWTQRRGTLRIDRLDTLGTAPPELTRQDAVTRYERAGRALVSRVKTWLQFPEWFYLKLPVNTVTEPRRTPGGLDTQYSSVGHFDLADDEAMVLTLPATDAPYLGFQIGSLWYISLEYIHHQTSLNNTQAQVDPDGMVRIVVSARNPGLTNWVETLGRSRGILQFRWQRLDRELSSADGPVAQVVPFDELPGALPFHESNRITPEDWAARIGARQAAVADRMLG
ncbi:MULTISPECIES: hypothetical protein [unclassified Rhodococcus (in: high G+C Gram-positive bacteria)]|uniref:hypothetical protein n=1 Tax=unclassified Rhodococcus (in: high G+C Gram-positive bacteria) TaxID=192944 RepID=UPI00146C96B5|nr:hypothetical protein [Rhodococcus sp. (in: high G+C Gram-positive bacteria)]MBF0663557.1 hypothetical protein [Rhodococcus sp. (in: high G+C Gram-positive bacteria)]NMD97195.1 hypothetical protein [Rhodococcus sp. BL-253-APC-6A1W]